MKQVKITELIGKEKEIDWSKPQWMQHIDFPTIIVLSTGVHADTRFQGIALPCKDYPYGSYSIDWHKPSFKTLESEIRFIISND